MKDKRHLILLELLCILILLSGCSFFESGIKAYTSKYFDIETLDSGKGKLIVHVNGNMEKTYNNTNPPWHQLRGSKKIIEIEIESGPENIGYWAFYNFPCVTDIEIPTGVKEIREAGFTTCESLETVVLPYSIEIIGSKAFEFDSNLKSINLPDGLREIGNAAFAGCKHLEEITLPDSLEDISGNAFANCENLKEIEIPAGIDTIRNGTFNGCTSLGKVTFPDSVRKIERNAFKGCSSLKSVSISSTAEVEDGAFPEGTEIEYR